MERDPDIDHSLTRMIEIFHPERGDGACREKRLEFVGGTVELAGGHAAKPLTPY